MFDQLHEECGVFGIYSTDPNVNVAQSAYYALFALQHRGQESCGIVVNDDGVMTSHKDIGLVENVFTKDTLDHLGNGQISIGHVRYGTSCSRPRLNAQPLVVNHIKGYIALAHNGNLVNSYDLREELEMNGSIFHTSGDAEVIAYIITRERLKAPSIEEAVCNAVPKLKGAYSLIIMSPSKLIAARDPHGFRPLCMGELDGSIIFASETCALDSLGANFIRDIEPGEIVVVDENGIRTIRTHCNKEKKALCIFEYIYFARPDSVIEGTSVHMARQRAGAFLAVEHPVDADVVIGVPDSGLDAAIGYSKQSGIPYGIGFIKNRYIGRTFIQPLQSKREMSVKIKLNPIVSTIKDKRVVMIDDSIVRGTTSGRIVRMLREAGAKEVHMRISSPPFKNPCFYGTDIDSKEHLIANNNSLDEIKELIGVDSLGYLSTDNLSRICNNDQFGYCSACFTGIYPTQVPNEKMKNRFDKKIRNSISTNN